MVIQSMLSESTTQVLWEWLGLALIVLGVSIVLAFVGLFFLIQWDKWKDGG